MAKHYRVPCSNLDRETHRIDLGFDLELPANPKALYGPIQCPDCLWWDSYKQTQIREEEAPIPEA
jgi:hypothetical protein